MATPAKPLIDWRKLLLPFLFIMVLPTVTAILVDVWLESLPFITIAAILICFPTATLVVIKTALNEMDRVIAEVIPPLTPEPVIPQSEAEASPEPEPEAESS